jgi:hypothetical protein
MAIKRTSVSAVHEETSSPMDEADQAMLVDSIRMSARSQSRWTRASIFSLFLVFGLFVGYAVVQLVSSPGTAIQWQINVRSPLSLRSILGCYICLIVDILLSLCIVTPNVKSKLQSFKVVSLWFGALSCGIPIFLFSE